MRRIPLLITIFTTAVLVVAAVIIGLLYRTSLAQETARLKEVAHSQARMIEAIARHEAKYCCLLPAESGHGDALAATLDQVRDANERFTGFGLTGEFSLARREDDSIIFLLTQRHPGPGRTMAIPFRGAQAEPMRRALSGLSGTVVGPDYRGVTVLAAHEPVSEFGLGVVAKIDLAEIQAPFVRTGLIGIMVALVTVLLGSLLFYRVTNPVLQQLQESESRQRNAQQLAHLGSWTLDLAKNELTWSDEVYRIFGLRPQEFAATYEAFLAAVHPDDRAAVDAAYSDSVRDNRDGYEIEHHVVRKDTGEVRIVEEKCEHVRNASGRIIRSVGMVHDITARKRAEEALHATMEDLKRSNLELEQFAYVASHDLQQPLRMVASYVELLGQRYKGRLDEKADKYIAYASGGAIRMHQLVNDLLAFSRVGTRTAPLVPVNLDRAVAQALENLTVAIEQSGAVVEAGPLPAVSGDETQLVQLFQNLLDNAVKFHGKMPPRVSVTCRDAGDEWEFAVRDNGIGIDPKHAERIFGVFKRLHTEQEYPGTGIGLALCRKIVERHGGRIHVDPAEGGGSVFRFTLPKQPAATSGEPAGAATEEV